MIAPQILAGFCAASYTQTPTWIYEDCAALLCWSDSIPVIAVRGTVESNPHNWLRDVDAWPTWDVKLGMCHTGFLSAARGLLIAVNQLLAANAHNTPPVFTGHSLGGAVAALMAAVSDDCRQLMQFNAPRPGGVGIGDALREAGIPITHYHWRGDDVVDVPDFLDRFCQPSPLINVGTEMDPIAAHSINNFVNLKEYPT
jgi:hypothetical protein